MNPNGYGLMTFPTPTAIKSIDGSKQDVVTKILSAFNDLEKNIGSLTPVPGHELACTSAWANLSAIRAELVGAYTGKSTVGHA